jgi:hypothetical protein
MPACALPVPRRADARVSMLVNVGAGRISVRTTAANAMTCSPQVLSPVRFEAEVPRTRLCRSPTS